HPRDYRRAMEEVIVCGGDTDTVAAILGGIVGAGVGREGIPTEWLNRLSEWPRSRQWMLSLCSQLHGVMESKHSEPASGVSMLGILVRNIFFMMCVLLHGFRRLFPPY
ncbi:ADP-ribosylglycohydrolase family protein, partial [Kaarinaea lacus]